MKIAIMQPYIFPYIGYFQLINSSDVFVFYDDVNFIKKGWINRNRILLNSSDHLITIPCIKVSQNKLINEVEVTNDKKTLGKILETIEVAYKKSDYFPVIYPIVEKVLLNDYSNIAEMAAVSIKEICTYLGIQNKFKFSSTSAYNNTHLKKADRLIDICKKENIYNYVNMIGGSEIYTKEYFKEKGIELNFLKPLIKEYQQFGNNFIPGLSIIDVLMFNSKKETLNLLTNFSIE